MKRRDFITILGGAAAAWPLLAHSQQPAVPVVGFLSARSPGESASVVAAFGHGLKEAGYIEGQNIHIAFRWADGQYGRLPALVSELIERRVAVIVSVGGEIAALAAKAATTTIPVVFVMGSDPVEAGVVASINRPGGNITGASLLGGELGTKRLELIRGLVPQVEVIGFLVNPNHPRADLDVAEMQGAARLLGQTVRVLNALTVTDFETAFASLVLQRAGSLIVNRDGFFNSQRDQIIALAARHAIPAIYESREHTEAGGLMSYGPSYSDTYRKAGVYTGRVLRGEKPADLPVQLPTKFELVINLKTAKILGLSMPPTLLALADEVIE